MKSTFLPSFLFHAKIALLFVVLSLLGGCSLFQKEREPALANYSDEHQRQSALGQIKHWQVSGKLIFKSPQKKFSASLNWTQQAQSSDIRLTSFLGTSIMKMVSNGVSATLESDGETFVSNNPESLLHETLGITLPINDLPQWMKGASPEYQNHTTVFDELKRIKQIKLLDNTNQMWHIDYQAYQKVAQHQLPKKIRLTGDDIVVTIKISGWELNSSD